MQEALHESAGSAEHVKAAFEEQQVTTAVQLSVTTSVCVIVNLLLLVGDACAVVVMMGVKAQSWRRL